ncbi:hypothetical protein BLIJ_1121 [Bifidobacterium longum subsp. infantis ATCC 15697 = JCM 1222 = DSM 20088]|nr:hypothetical protein BLIJ_1121 [Bifidobacterium longum subsp. infantis ATCC 15697 = JCM 1222 = DSM 20088]
MDYFPSNWSGRVSGLCRALDALTLRLPCYRRFATLWCNFGVFW